jgi:hypothetical protein
LLGQTGNPIPLKGRAASRHRMRNVLAKFLVFHGFHAIELGFAYETEFECGFLKGVRSLSRMGFGRCQIRIPRCCSMYVLEQFLLHGCCRDPSLRFLGVSKLSDLCEAAEVI